MKPLNRQTLAWWYKVRAGAVSYRNLAKLELDAPLISFTFDDFPHSALSAGGEILKDFGAAGTYYVSLGLLNTDSPSGRICTEEDVVSARNDGHEIGCHTFSHYDSWDTAKDIYETDIEKNSAALQKLLPGVRFKTFSYPKSLPRPALKRICSKRFVASRGGRQRANSGTIDLNQLFAFFLEKARDDFSEVERIIDENAAKKGWLIFGTHDVATTPSPYGCTPDFFRRVVQYSVNSGARILPVIDAVSVIQGGLATASKRPEVAAQ